MRKKLDTRFPASRIKKIMQADEDVGKIAMAVPLLVSKALESFLEDLCQRTYDITLQRGAKTVSAFHLKQCIHSFNVYDFLREIVNKVPDLGGSDAAAEDRAAAKRRKTCEEEDNDTDDEVKRSRMHHDTGNNSSSGRGRGRGRGRGGRGRGQHAQAMKCEDDPDMSPPQHDNQVMNPPTRLDNGTEAGTSVGSSSTNLALRNFDLNVDLHVNGGDTSMTIPIPSPAPPPAPSADPPLEMQHEEYPGWSNSDIGKVPIDPLELVHLHRSIDEDDEDYDEEG